MPAQPSRNASFAAIGCRVMHGGPRLVAPTRINAEVLANIESLDRCLPLHQPHHVEAIRVVIGEHTLGVRAASRFAQLSGAYWLICEMPRCSTRSRICRPQPASGQIP